MPAGGELPARGGVDAVGGDVEMRRGGEEPLGCVEGRWGGEVRREPVEQRGRVLAHVARAQIQRFLCLGRVLL